MQQWWGAMQTLPSWSTLCELVIRPKRNTYSPDALGAKQFLLAGKAFQRTDLEIINKRGQKLQCSHFEPIHRKSKQMPCVVYCHGNCGNRLTALQTVSLLLPHDITVFCFDFAGCGNSEGDVVSLGYYEHQDLACIVDHLRLSGTVSTIGLWGRSMGSVTCLLYAAGDASIAGMIIDSPFYSLPQLIQEIVTKTASYVPGFVTSIAIKMLRRSIRSRAGFDIEQVNPEVAAKGCWAPVIIAHGTRDALIDPKHAKIIYKAYAGDKTLQLLERHDHNDRRPEFFQTSALIFLLNRLHLEEKAKQVQAMLTRTPGSHKKKHSRRKSSHHHHHHHRQSRGISRGKPVYESIPGAEVTDISDLAESKTPASSSSSSSSTSSSSSSSSSSAASLSSLSSLTSIPSSDDLKVLPRDSSLHVAVPTTPKSHAEKSRDSPSRLSYSFQEDSSFIEIGESKMITVTPNPVRRAPMTLPDSTASTPAPVDRDLGSNFRGNSDYPHVKEENRSVARFDSSPQRTLYDTSQDDSDDENDSDSELRTRPKEDSEEFFDMSKDVIIEDEEERVEYGSPRYEDRIGIKKEPHRPNNSSRSPSASSSSPSPGKGGGAGLSIQPRASPRRRSSHHSHDSGSIDSSKRKSKGTSSSRAKPAPSSSSSTSSTSSTTFGVGRSRTGTQLESPREAKKGLTFDRAVALPVTAVSARSLSPVRSGPSSSSSSSSSSPASFSSSPSSSSSSSSSYSSSSSSLPPPTSRYGSPQGRYLSPDFADLPDFPSEPSFSVARGQGIDEDEIQFRRDLERAKALSLAAY